MNGSPIKVLRVTSRYAPAWQYGGSVRYSYDIDVALARLGFDITVYASDQVDGAHRSTPRTDRLDGVDIHRFANPWNALAHRAPWLGLYPIGMRRALRRNAPTFDVIHVTEARGAHVRWACAAARDAGVPVVWSPLGALADGVGIRRPYRRMYDVLHHTRRLVAEAEALIAQSAHEALVFERLGARSSQVRTIGLGVDKDMFWKLPPRGELRRALGVGASQPIVLYLGRFHPTKGLDVLIRAVAVARRRYAELQLVLIGWDNGALRRVQRIARALGVEHAVRILPPALDSSRLEAYVDADVFAASLTTFEETSLAAMEALACGTPCVLTKQCEIPGLEAAGGGLVAACEPEALGAALVKVLSDPRRASRAAGARRWMLTTQTTERVAAAHADVFRAVLGVQHEWEPGLPERRVSSWSRHAAR